MRLCYDKFGLHTLCRFSLSFADDDGDGKINEDCAKPPPSE
jgi:hypothetical protein